MTFITVKPETGKVAFPRFSTLMENFFENEFPGVIGSEFSRQVPLVNIKETKENYQIEIAAPGYTKEQFQITLEENILTISGEQQAEEKKEGEKYTRREFNFSAFKRSFTLPKTVVAHEISATAENGILMVTLPKAEEAKPKGKVEIKIN